MPVVKLVPKHWFCVYDIKRLEHFVKFVDKDEIWSVINDPDLRLTVIFLGKRSMALPATCKKRHGLPQAPSVHFIFLGM